MGHCARICTQVDDSGVGVRSPNARVLCRSTLQCYYRARGGVHTNGGRRSLKLWRHLYFASGFQSVPLLLLLLASFPMLIALHQVPTGYSLSKCLKYPCVVLYPHLFCLVYAIRYLRRLTHEGNTERAKADPAVF
jgi:hypothetical protein